MSLKNRIPEKLVEIKKGQTGVGLLIESDGYVSADMTENNKKIINNNRQQKDNKNNVFSPWLSSSKLGTAHLA